jgi:hypothetical protein
VAADMVVDVDADMNIDVAANMDNDMDADVYDDITITARLFMGQYQKWPI